jgi:hypothetical protein
VKNPIDMTSLQFDFLVKQRRERDTDYKDRSAQIIRKIYSLCDLASANSEHNRT